MGGIVKGIVGAVGSLFGGGRPKTTTITQAAPPPTPTPTIDSAAEAEQESNRFRRRRGRAANVLSTPQSTSTSGNTATKALLGS